MTKSWYVICSECIEEDNEYNNQVEAWNKPCVCPNCGSKEIKVYEQLALF
jgi:Zn finger protein HypA/HybF involved in hydrogenase expression